MATSGSIIADAASMGPAYAKRLTESIPADQFARLASPGGKTIQANHPAFVLGHLALYPVKVLELLGQDSGDVMPPESFQELFSKDATCVDDPDSTIYPKKEEILAFFEKSYSRAIAALRDATDEQLAADNPVDSPMRNVCTSLGSLLAFYMTGHVMIHLGQLSTWRRMQGLPPA